MRAAKLVTFLMVAVVLAWTAGLALAEEAYPAAGSGGTAAGQGAWSNAGLGRMEGQIVGISRGSGSTTLTVRVMAPDKPAQDMQVQLTDQTPVSQGILAKRPDDLSVGSHVWLDYEQRNGKTVADEIGILDPPVPVRGIEGPDIQTS